MIAHCCLTSCSKPFDISTGHYNRAMKVSGVVYCCREHARIARRKTTDEKKATKALYDKTISVTPERKQKQKEYYKKAYLANPEKYKQIRKNQYSKHLEYLRTPEYKEWKQKYDRKHLAKKHFGVFWEAALLLNDLEEFLITNSPEGMKFSMGITNKNQKRKRLWQRQQRQKN